MEACLIATGLVLTAAVVVVLALVLRPAAATESHPPADRPPRARFEYCPACDSPVFVNDRACPECGLHLDSHTADQLERMRVVRRNVRRLHDEGLLDREAADRVVEQLDHQRRRLTRRVERPAEAERPHAAPPPLPPQVPVPFDAPAIPAPAPPEPRPAAGLPLAELPPLPPPVPRRSLAEHLGRFMHERNILWGELAGGLLIVGCSIALVLSLWRTLEALPYFTFLLSAGITGAVFGAGYYTFHHWRLAATSRGLLAIALLLTPLNLLLLADPGSRGTADWIDVLVKVTAVAAFAGLVRTGGRDFAGTDELPGQIPRRWLLAVAVVGAPAALMVPAPADLRSLPMWLSLVAFLVATAPTVFRVNRDGRRPDAPALGERPGTALLLFVGLGLFALFAAWGLFLARVDDLPTALRHLSLPVVLAGSVVVVAGLVVQQRVTEPAALRAGGTAVALFGMVVLFASLGLAWPSPVLLAVAALLVATVLGELAFTRRLPWLYAGAVPCLALVPVVLQVGSAPAGVDPERWLAFGIVAAPSGAALALCALALAAVAEVSVRFRRLEDSLALALSAAGVAVVALLIATVHGIEEPWFATGTHLACAVGFVAASFRWRFRVVAQAGVWLVLLASLWGLWATVPNQPARWGLAVALEAVALAVVALALGSRPALRRLGAACRDVSAAAAILAPVLALMAARFPRGDIHTGTLFAVAATALVLARLYRHPAVTWVGSLAGLVALGHLIAFTLEVEPGRLAALLALLAHATLAMAAALMLGRAEPRKGPDDDSIGPLTGLRSPGLYAEPLRLSGRLTSALAVPVLFVPAAGFVGVWAGLAVWVGVLFLVAAVAWRERGAFAAFQGAITWAAGLTAFTWVEQQDWFATAAAVDPRAVQAYGVAGGLLTLGWFIVRRLLRRSARARELWADVWPSVDQVVLGALVVGHLFVATGWVVPHARAELLPVGHDPGLLPGAAVHLGGLGAWLLVGVLAAALALALRWPTDDSNRADFPVLGLTVLGLTVPVLVAGRFAPELAAASALRWGLAAVFLAGSIVLACRESIGRATGRLGFAPGVSALGLAGIRVLLLAGAGVVMLLTLQVAVLGLSGQAPAGPVVGSVYRDIGWTASVMVPLVALVAGLAGTAVRERSAGYASAGGWVFTLAVAGGYALGIVAGGGRLGDVELMRVGLLAVGATAGWALIWLAVEWRVPNRTLLTIHTVTPFAGLAALAVIPLSLIVTGVPVGRTGTGPFVFGSAGWPMLLLTAAAGYWHARRAWPEGRFHVIGYAAAVAGVLAAALDRWANPASGWTFHVLAAAWVANGALIATFLFWPPVPGLTPPLARRMWPELLAGGMTVLALRAGPADRWWSLAAVLVFVAGLLIGAVAFAARSRVREYVSGGLVALAAVFVAVHAGVDTGSSVALAVAIALATSAWAWTELRGHGLVAAFARVPEEAALDYDDAGERSRVSGPMVSPSGRLRGSARPGSLPPFAHVAALLGLGLVLFGLIPSWWAADVDSPWLAWAAVLAVGGALGVMLRWDRRQRFAPGGLYTLGAAAVALAVAGVVGEPVWLHWPTPPALGGYALAAAALAWRFGLRRPATEEVRPWLLVGQGVLAALVIGMGVRTAVSDAPSVHRMMGPLGALFLCGAAAFLTRAGAATQVLALRRVTLALGVVAPALLAWAIPDPTGTVPWLHRHATLFVVLTGYAAAYLHYRSFGPPVDPSFVVEARRAGGVVGLIALAVLGVVLVQQIPLFDPITKTTPLHPVAVGAVLVATLGLIVLAIRLALRPDRDPLGPTPHGRAGYVYLAEVLLVLLFAHVRLNIPQVFTGQAVRYWTFVVMFLAFVGVGLAELFARRGLRVLSRPLLRTGVLLPLIPLLVFWAKPPVVVFEFADARAPGLRPMLGYLEKLPQHFDTYALLWLLAGLLYGLIALSRRSFGWALLGALATNAGLWALLTHHQVPAAVHPQAWAIPLALIVLGSEHVNRHRLRADVASGLRYLGISLIYVSSAADLFIAGVGQSVWLPIVLAALCLAGVVAGVLLRVRAFLYLGIGFLLLDVFAMIWHAAVDRAQTWVWYASGIVLGIIILAVFAVLEKRRNDVRELVGRLREWD